LAEAGVLVPLAKLATVSTASITPFVTASSSAESDPEDEFVQLLTKNFFDSMKGSLSLLFKSKKTPFSVLKTSLLHCIESIKTVGGPGSVVALERVMTDFERDVEAWQAVRHAEIFPKADAEFQHLSG
jgi:hypothetical protein